MAARPRLTSPFSGLSAIALSAAAGMSIELLAVRSAAFHFGASFPLWTAMIAVMLAGLAIGHPIGGFFASRYPARWIVAGCWVSAASSAALLPSLFGPLHASFGHLPLPWLSLLAAAISVGPAAIAFGIAVPAASLRALEQPPTPGKIRKPIRSRRARARIMGWIHAAGAAGSVTGTLFTGLAALPWMGSIPASYALAALLLACAAIGLAKPFWARIAVASSAVLLAGLAALAASGHLPGKALPGWKILEREDTRYNALLIRSFGERRELILNGARHGEWTPGQPLAYMPPLDAALRVARPRRALFLGGGSYVLPRMLVASNPGARATAVEIDSGVTKAVRKHMGLERFEASHDESSLRVLHLPARVAVQRLLASGERFDWILLDVHARDAALPQLATREFFAALSRLSPDGSLPSIRFHGVAHPRSPLPAAWARALEEGSGRAVRAGWQSRPADRKSSDPAESLANFVLATTTLPAQGYWRFAPGLRDHHAPVERLALARSLVSPFAPKPLPDERTR